MIIVSFINCISLNSSGTNVRWWTNVYRCSLLELVNGNLVFMINSSSFGGPIIRSRARRTMEVASWIEEEVFGIWINSLHPGGTIFDCSEVMWSGVVASTASVSVDSIYNGFPRVIECPVIDTVDVNLTVSIWVSCWSSIWHWTWRAVEVTLSSPEEKLSFRINFLNPSTTWFNIFMFVRCLWISYTNSFSMDNWKIGIPWLLIPFFELKSVNRVEAGFDKLTAFIWSIVIISAWWALPVMFHPKYEVFCAWINLSDPSSTLFNCLEVVNSRCMVSAIAVKMDSLIV